MVDHDLARALGITAAAPASVAAAYVIRHGGGTGDVPRWAEEWVVALGEATAQAMSSPKPAAELARQISADAIKDLGVAVAPALVPLIAPHEVIYTTGADLGHHCRAMVADALPGFVARLLTTFRDRQPIEL